MRAQNHLLEAEAKRAGGPTWETVRYMVAAIQYGGRITDELDKLLMATYAEKYFHQVRQPLLFSCRLSSSRAVTEVHVSP